MKQKLLAVFLVGSICFYPASARADFWGADVVVLTQILANALEELAQLRAILGAGQDSLDLMRSINQGINDSLGLLSTISHNRSAGIYGDWQQPQDSLSKLQTLYGVTPKSTDSRVQQDADQSVAEAVTLNNSIYGYTAQLDDLGEQVKASSHTVSPGGAQKLTAQTLGVMVEIMNESLRAQATSLKLQAQTLAIENRKDKEVTKHLLNSSDTLSSAMKNERTAFELPRF